jgi:dTDP-4-dehydrorhamnose reductase
VVGGQRVVYGVTRYLVTGGTGQLAQALGRAAGPLVELVGRPMFDLDKPETLAALFAKGIPDIVINTAAWTAVDAAEASPDAASRANAEGPAVLAALCRQHGTRMIHISTDYVFDGTLGAPYRETDPTSPTGVYGATKLRGEHAVLAAMPDAVVLRTAWVYAETGKNFLRTMLAVSKRTNTLRVVADQRGCPTNADDLASVILSVADRMLTIGGAPGGVYHAAGSGSTTWHGFAEAIFMTSRRYGWPAPEVHAISTADWPTPARRPPDSRLNCDLLAQTFGVRLPDWEPSLERAVTALCSSEPPL